MGSPAVCAADRAHGALDRTDRVIPSIASVRSLHPERPLNWHDYAEAWLDYPLGAVLDYGCGNGAFLERIAKRCTARYAVDIDAEKVEAAGRHAGITARPITSGDRLPFEDATFDTVTILDVIEHVTDENAVLVELARVLKPQGRLLLTTPHRGLLTFLDPGNFKFVAPGVHRFIHRRLLGQKDYYNARFGSGRRSEQGMIADFSTDQIPWHRHYPYHKLRALAPDNLKTLGYAVYSPAFRALWTLRLALKVLTLGRVRDLPRPLRWLERRLSRVQSRLGDQLVVLFEKQG